MNVNMVIHGQGHPLVLFHGWGFDVHIWSPLLSVLTSQYQICLVDLPGFGLTEPMAWDVFEATLLEQLPARFALAGWSMGGLLATRLAIDARDRVSHLVNIASSPRFIREKHWPGVDGQLFNVFYDDLLNHPQQTLEQFITLQFQSALIPPVVLGHLPSLSGLRSGLDVLLNWDLRDSLAQLNMPVYYMFGRLDVIMPRRTMIIMQAMYPQFHYIQFSKAAHAPFLSHPEQFMAALGEFLQ
ncbi:MAG: alpha/beta fold hydrolase [Legionellales bacterium]|nr:alpha/beta fold hydrolase [Legionellales bacterium]